jgi:[ribosomal protein S5]-alanine N-acetyltransferase
MNLIIRPWKKEDASALTAIANNINIWNMVRDRLPHPYTLESAISWIDFTNNQNPTCNFAIEADGFVAGSIGFILMDDVYKRNIEIGYFIGEIYWGRGIASMAVNQLIEMLLSQYHPVRIFATVFENNPASMRVLEKNGFALESVQQKAVYKNQRLMDQYYWVKLFSTQL